MTPGGAFRTARVLADEIGLAFVRCGDTVIKTAFEPVFETDPDVSRLAALRASGLRVRIEQQTGEGADQALPVDDPDFEFGCALAHLRNYLHGAADECGLLMLTLPLRDHGLMSAFLDAAEEELGWCETEFSLSGLVVELEPAAEEDPTWLERAAGLLRDRGAGLCLGGFGPRPATTEAVRALVPAIVCLDAEWMRDVARSDEARRLLRPLVQSIRSGGSRVLADALDDEGQVALCREIGVDLMAGPVLAPPFAAGTAERHRSQTLPQSDASEKVVFLSRPA